MFGGIGVITDMSIFEYLYCFMLSVLKLNLNFHYLVAVLFVSRVFVLSNLLP